MSVKAIVIAILVVLLLVMSYRIVDLGSTLTYLKKELEETQRQANIFRLFQRSSCIRIDDIPKEFSAFEKGGLMYINGLAFECRTDEKTNQKLLYYVGDTSENRK